MTLQALQLTVICSSEQIYEWIGSHTSTVSTPGGRLCILRSIQPCEVEVHTQIQWETSKGETLISNWYHSADTYKPEVNHLLALPNIIEHCRSWKYQTTQQTKPGYPFLHKCSISFLASVVEVVPFSLFLPFLHLTSRSNKQKLLH